MEPHINAIDYDGAKKTALEEFNRYYGEVPKSSTLKMNTSDLKVECKAIPLFWRKKKIE